MVMFRDANSQERAALNAAVASYCESIGITEKFFRDHYEKLGQAEFRVLSNDYFSVSISSGVAEIMTEKYRAAAQDQRVIAAQARHAAEKAAAEKESGARGIMDRVFDRLTPGIAPLTPEAACRVNLIAALDLFTVAISPKKNLSVMAEIHGRELTTPEKLRMLKPFSKDDLLYHAEVCFELIGRIAGKFPTVKFRSTDLKDFIAGNRPRPTPQGHPFGAQPTPTTGTTKGE